MDFAFQIATPAELEDILAFSESRLNQSEPDTPERMFKAWHAPWRKEALEHYLKLGWSFVARNKANNKLEGYFLGQALLFLRGQTQTLWIEFLDATTADLKEQLAEIAIRTAREKHLQRTLFSEACNAQAAIKNFPVSTTQDKFIEVKTTKG